MTEHEDRALWVQTKTDYEHARMLAFKIWGEDIATDPATCNAVTATLLIHHKDLSRQERLHVRVPQAAVTRGITSPRASGDTPTCKECGGAMEDKRTTKKTPKSPDFVCLQENGKCGKPSKDGKFFNATAQWVEKPNPKGAQGMATAVTGGRNFNEKPEVLDDEDTSDLPF